MYFIKSIVFKPLICRNALYNFTKAHLSTRCAWATPLFSCQFAWLEERKRKQLHLRYVRSISLSSLHYTKEEDKTKQSDEEVPVSVKNRLIIVAILVTSFGISYYFANKKKQAERLEERETQMSKVDIGAQDYSLIDNTGKKVSKKDFLGKWLLLYFGFTHCPDICPEELEKMSEIVDLVDADKSVPNLQPIFLTVDPSRDTPEVITTYLSEFSPKFIGLTGTEEEIKHATKAFRVYYQAGPKDVDDDYIVDHTIVMYLINPKGNFVDYYGSRSVPTERIVNGITENMKNYKRFHG